MKSKRVSPQAQPTLLLALGRPADAAIECVLTCDEAYAPYAAVTLASVFKHAAGAVHATVLTTGMAPAVVQRFARVQQAPHSLSVIEVQMGSTAAFGSKGHWPHASYLRLALAELLTCDRVIYLDCDLLVHTSLDALFAIDLGPHLIAGVPEFPANLLLHEPALNWLGLPAGDFYMNAGVLLLDLPRLCQHNLLPAALEVYQSDSFRPRFADQCLLNVVLAGRKMEVPPDWNIRNTATLKPTFKRWLLSGTKGIFHFNGPEKPWTHGADPEVTALWSQYLALTDYTLPEVQRPASLSSAAVASDIEVTNAQVWQAWKSAILGQGPSKS